MTESSTDWNHKFKLLIRQYRKEPSALNDDGSLYRLLVMVLLAAQTSDNSVNIIAPRFFESFPTMKSLSLASKDELTGLLNKIRFHRKKIEWLQEISRQLQDDKNIPKNMAALTALPGIGRKSANIILRASGAKAEGIMVDLHVLRVVDRLGIIHTKDAIQMEMALMQVVSPKLWGNVGSALSSLGRKVCRPTNPIHSECLLNDVCEYCLAKRSINETSNPSGSI